MFKQVMLFKRRPGMTAAEFKDYYENHHARLSERVGDGRPLLDGRLRYVRRYIHPVANLVTGEVIEPDFDVIMEIWWRSRADFEAGARAMQRPEVRAAVLADEAMLFATHSNPTFWVEEHDSAIAAGEAEGTAAP